LRTELSLPAGEATSAAPERYAGFGYAEAERSAAYFEVLYRKFDATQSDAPVRVARGRESVCIERDDFFAEYDFGTKSGVLHAVDSIYIIDTFLRVFMSLMLPERNGLLMHASGMLVDGRAHLFVGPSGSGKSTAARFSPPGGMLSDELTAVKIRGGKVRVHGTPFMGELAVGGQNKSGTAAGIYFLNRKLPHGKTEVSASRAVALMLGSVMNFDKSPKQVSSILDIVCAVCRSAPCFEFNFNKKGDLLELLNG